MAIVDIPDNLTEPANKLLVPLSSAVGNTLKDAWELVFGGFGTYVEKKRLTRQKALEDFRQSLEDKVAAIPAEKLCEPPLAIIGPALDASKYYFEEPELREMFANLIAAAMNGDTASRVHPSFTEIIRQMSPLDAQNLALFTSLELPVGEYRLEFSDGNFKTIEYNIFLANPAVSDLVLQAGSISSLARLGLIEVTYEQFLAEDARYSGFTETPLYQVYEQTFNTDSKHMILKKGVVSLTPIGEQFKEVCLPSGQS